MVQSSNTAGDVNPQQPQPWMQQYPWMAAVQYPMMMQQQQQQQQQMMMVMYPHHPYSHHQPYMAAHPPHLPPSPYTHPIHHQLSSPHHHIPHTPHSQIKNSASSAEDNRTIWVGDLHPWMDEGYLYSCFAASGQVSSVKIIRNKQTGQSEGYGFVELFSHEAAEKVLLSYNGTLMPSSDQPFRLNWATFGASERKTDQSGGSDLSIFVGDLAPDVTDTLLQETFSSKYPSVKGAKVVMDQNTGRSKGYGFVRFGDDSERTRAMTEMNGVYCSSRPMRIGVATPKKLLVSNQQQQYSSQAVVLAGGYAANGGRISLPASDSTNTTIFVGGIESDTSDEDLRQAFSQFGEVVNVKIPFGKGCGFVQFANRSDAEDALQKLNGAVIGKHAVRLSWGRNVGMKQVVAAENGN